MEQALEKWVKDRKHGLSTLDSVRLLGQLRACACMHGHLLQLQANRRYLAITFGRRWTFCSAQICGDHQKCPAMADMAELVRRKEIDYTIYGL